MIKALQLEGFFYLPPGIRLAGSGEEQGQLQFFTVGSYMSIWAVPTFSLYCVTQLWIEIGSCTFFSSLVSLILIRDSSKNPNSLPGKLNNFVRLPLERELDFAPVDDTFVRLIC
jgi:hypothetical protein